MGAWGYYDDQQDAVMDEWDNLLERVVPKTTKDRGAFLRQNETMVYRKLFSQVTILILEDAFEETDSVALGLILVAVRFFSTKKTQQEELITGFSSRIVRIETRETEAFPRELPALFPKELCLVAQLLCKRLLDRADTQDLWKDADLRKQALEMEWDLFQCGGKATRMKTPVLKTKKHSLRKKTSRGLINTNKASSSLRKQSVHTSSRSNQKNFLEQQRLEREYTDSIGTVLLGGKHLYPVFLRNEGTKQESMVYLDKNKDFQIVTKHHPYRARGDAW